MSTPQQIDASSRALLVDYGGVLTKPLSECFASFETTHGMEAGTIYGVLATVYSGGDEDGSIARLERGELSDLEFGDQLSAGFAMLGVDVSPEAAIRDLFSDLGPHGGLWGVVGAARSAGVRTSLLSNSWGVDSYPRAQLGEVFDHLVISGEIGMRKPARDIFVHAAGIVGLPLHACAFVDDIQTNVDAALEYGMFGVLHTDAATTAATLETFLGVPLVAAVGPPPEVQVP